jgi:hypothetical protein
VKHTNTYVDIFIILLKLKFFFRDEKHERKEKNLIQLKKVMFAEF